MKLYPILFEAAKTPKEAMRAGLGLYVSKTSDDFMAVLIDTQRCQEVIESYNQLHKGSLKEPEQEEKKDEQQPQNFSNDPRVPPWKTKEQGAEYLRQQGIQEGVDSKNAKYDWLEKQLGNRAIIGSVTARYKDVERGDDLWMINTTSAVQKYGPLLYEITLAALYPNYVRSDFSLTPDSRNIWNYMYWKRSDVEQKWVGSWGERELGTSWNVSGMSSQRNIEKILEKIEDDEPISEQEFMINFVQKLSKENLKNIGPFYAYRLAGKKTTIGSYDKLIANGDSVVEEIAGAFELNVKEVEYAIEGAASVQFNRLYNKGRG